MYATVPIELPGLVRCSSSSKCVCVRIDRCAGQIPLPIQRAAQLGQAEIQNFRRPAFDQKNIRGLDVAVNDALGVRRFQAVGNLNADVQKFGNVDAAFRQCGA